MYIQGALTLLTLLETTDYFARTAKLNLVSKRLDKRYHQVVLLNRKMVENVKEVYNRLDVSAHDVFATRLLDK